MSTPDFFRARLDAMVDLRHPLAVLGGLLVGVLVGALLATLAGRVIESRSDPWPEAVMNVLSHELRAVGRLNADGQCATPAMADSVRELQLLALDIEPAFLETGSDDRVFRQYATDLRGALDRVAAAGSDCKLASAAATEVGNSCKACHRDYR